MSLSDICIAIDMDGFFVGPKFTCRELGVCSLTKPYTYGTQSYRFNLNPLVDQLTLKNFKSARVCTKYIHGLSFTSLSSEKGVFEVHQFVPLLRKVYAENVRGKRIVAAYKGGNYERDILKEMDIPSLNLEIFGCPKIEEISHLLAPSMTDCGYHTGLDSSVRFRIAHCPKLHSTVYKEWIAAKIEEAGEEENAADC